MALLGGAFLVVGVVLAMFTQAGPTSDESARAAIDDLMQQRYHALLTGDIDRYMRTVDPARGVLRTCEDQRFQTYVRLGMTPDAPVIGRVEKWGDYLRVWFDTSVGWKRLFVRYDGARWYVSEPTSAELGDEESKDIEGVTVSYRAAESDVIDAIAAELPSIIDSVTAHAPTPPSHLFSLRVDTLTTASGNCFIAGLAQGRGSTLITLRDIGLTPGYNHLSRDTSATIEHEALHWLQIDRSATAMRSMDWWLVEGWPFLVANTDLSTIARRGSAVCDQPALEYEDLRFGPRFDARPEAAQRLYLAASLLVERISKSGGDSAYWRIFDAFDDSTSDPFVRVTGADGSAFFRSWLADARKQYC